MARSKKAERRRATVKAVADDLKAAVRALPQKRFGGPPAARQTTAALKAIVDRHNVLELKVKGLTYRQIGARLGISHVHAMDLAYEAAAELVLKDRRTVEVLRTIEGERLEEAHRAIVPLVHGQVPEATRVVGKGKRARAIRIANDPLDVARVQVAAAQRVTNISGRRSALFGLDAPIKIAPTDPSGTRRYAEMSEDELAAERERLRALLGSGAIDVTPGRNGDGRHGGNGNGGPPAMDGGV